MTIEQAQEFVDGESQILLGALSLTSVEEASLLIGTISSRGAPSLTSDLV